MKLRLMILILLGISPWIATASRAPAELIERLSELHYSIQNVILIDHTTSPEKLKIEGLSANELSCERKQIAEFEKAANSFGGTAAVADGLRKILGRGAEIIVNSFGNAKPDEAKRMDIDVMTAESSSFVMNANLYIDQKSHVVTCDVNSADEIISKLSDKRLALKLSKPKVTGGAGSGQTAH